MTTTPAKQAEPAPESMAAFTLRIPALLLADVDAAAKRWTTELGFTVSRTDAVTRLLRQALEAKAEK